MDNFFIDGHKLFWHLDRVAEWQGGQLTAPVYIEISPVNYCNHNCTFCGIDFARTADMKLDTAILSKRLVEMGNAGVRSIMFAGEGEPFLHPDLTELVRTAKNAGIDVSITSNGSIGNDRQWEEILPLLTWIRFSVDAGTAPVYAGIHKVSENAFTKVINNIKNAVRIRNEKNLPVTIGVQFLVIDENLNDMENAINLFSEIGVDYLSFKPFSVNPQMISRKDVIYNEETIAGINALVESYKSKTPMKIIFRADAMEKYMSGKHFFSHCRALPFWGYISSNGSFYTCSIFIGDERFEAGNINNNTMEEILFGEKRQSSVCYAENELTVGEECRLNCRMSRINEFLEFLANKPQHINFI